MEEKIKCPKCDSKDIKEVDSPEDFLSWKPEGETAGKGKVKTKQKYFCHNCNYNWEENIKYE
ncbi:MAG: hypothetical protein PHO90_02940 [Candidatus Pacebacteria bacterium]|nr:hypothetical protein [Candidatus Paceibacterota bacterium]